MIGPKAAANAMCDIVGLCTTTEYGKRYKRLGSFLSIAVTAYMLLPDIEGVKIMTDENMIFLMSTVAVLVGAFLGPLLLEAKAKAMGNTLDKLDFFGMIIGMILGALFAYMVTDVWGGLATGQIGDWSYVMIGLISSMILSGLITLFATAFMGDDWSISILDRNKNGKLDVGDITTGASEIASGATSVASAVKEGAATVIEAADNITKK